MGDVYILLIILYIFSDNCIETDDGQIRNNRNKVDTLCKIANIVVLLILCLCVMANVRSNLESLKLIVFRRVQHIQGVTGGMCETSGECSLGQTIPI